MMKKWWILALVLALLAAALSGCFSASNTPDANTEPTPSQTPGDNTVSGTPKLPEKLQLVDGVPQLKVYNLASKSIEKMDLESYVEGVLAGEMRNDWPMEALKAQAILARTFVLKFVSEKKSQYEGADISTDIKEAQAYDAEAINERVKRAVDETRGMVMVSGSDFPYAWFHAHAGGKTELAKAALDYKEAEPPYTQVVDSPDSDKAPDAVKQWTVSFTSAEVAKGCADAGQDVGGAVDSIAIGEKGESGRAVTFTVNGKTVSGPALRLALDGKKLKSTLLDSVTLENGNVTFTGKGYGHGVGMSQWGAYGLAEQDKKAEDIVKHYFKNVEITKLWS